MESGNIEIILRIFKHFRNSYLKSELMWNLKGLKLSFHISSLQNHSKHGVSAGWGPQWHCWSFPAMIGLNHTIKTCKKHQQRLASQNIGDICACIRASVLAPDNRIKDDDRELLMQRIPGPATGNSFIEKYGGSVGWNFCLLLMKECLSIRTARLPWQSVFYWAKLIADFTLEYKPNQVPDDVVAHALEAGQETNVLCK